MGEVVELNVVTSLDISVERILRKAVEHDLESVVVLGWTKDGDSYFGSSVSGGPEILWLLEVTKKELLEVSPEDVK